MIELLVKRLETLVHRLDGNHPSFPLIEKELTLKASGLYGENSLDYHLYFLRKDYDRLNGLHLQRDEYYFQMDCLLISGARLILIEVKHMAGKLIYEHDSHQLVQKGNGVERAYPEPLIQVKRQSFQLKNWLKKWKLPSIPLENYVVFTHPSANLSSDHPHVFRSEYLPFELNHLLENHTWTVWTKQAQQLFHLKCKENHHTLDYIVFEKFNVHKDQLKKGVLCNSCTLKLPVIGRGSQTSINCLLKIAEMPSNCP
ncbi:nuclease-related domain-containing protein [Halobacillus mangrovi]|uniref:NERD domain-containing protein n=1 Tax=Halobacillus mangrovi TaxID=402384 RepID=A0A1W5ZTN8_9BACI|nr:nuclease-related domain-containing protein [Halobacillus mangrovi]ARI76633.1 hypothetical protein HM131_07180 [Halobacillus mangrovi]